MDGPLMGDRRPNAAAEALLFAVSTRCAYPNCRVPTVSLTVDKKANKNVQAAHIVPVSQSMPRWRPMDAADRDNYQNLVLLCSAHHLMVDKGPRARDFTEAMLLAWKEEAEHDLREKFDGIDRYTFEDVEDMIGLAAAQGTEVITSGIGKLGAKVDSATAEILTVLYEQFADKHRDYEVAAMLNAASERLASEGFAETVGLLDQASDRLANLDDQVSVFDDTFRPLKEFKLNTFVTAADQSKSAADTLEVHARTLSHAIAPRVQAALDPHSHRWQSPLVNATTPRIDRMHIFLLGLVIGVILSVALAWAVVRIAHAS
ncbi:HNH endonuclease signature motif containing protein [Nocardioides sp.]|uniref:HNH endonuclease signature motif containing protein n=1 Tax=Nocardioides sp. TaxID=35761 RepID=UPI0019AF6351|nr:HNH endonuclease signature motif containing protein [Nocardioides sp.]MBC7274963.1 HNH endonuclease [Nocardioides sp.]